MRALRKLKLQREQEAQEEESDHEEEQEEFVSTPLNAFALLQAESSDSESEESVESLDEAANTQIDMVDKQAHTLAKPKDKSKAADVEDDWELLLVDFKQDKQTIAVQEPLSTLSLKQILGINSLCLDPQVELKRMFGSVAVEEQTKSKGRARKRVPVKDGILVKFKDTWPRLTKLGLSMEVLRMEGVFSFDHSRFYNDIQIQFYQAVQTHSPNTLVQLLHMFPYHIDSLLQLSEVCRMSGDSEMTIQCVERALFAFEKAFHPTFQFSTCSCKLDFDRVENRSFFLAVFRQIQIVTRQGCWRTALEWSKLLFSINIDQDPYAVILMLDFFALKSNQYEWVIEFWELFKDSKKLNLFPNWTFSRALATFELESLQKKDHTNSSKMLVDAILVFPSIIPQLFQLASINDDVSHPFFSQQEESSWLEIVVKIFMINHSSLWKMSDSITWMRESVKTAFNLVSQQENLLHGSEIRSTLLKEEIPSNILRFIIVSDIDSLRRPISPFISRQIHSYDPLPPPTAIRSTYDVFFETQRNSNPLANATFLSGLFRSFLPWTNTENLPEAFENAQPVINRQHAALLAAQNEMPQFFGANQTVETLDWLQTLRDSLMELVENPEEDQNDDNSE